MANDKKWIDWDEPITILGLLAIVVAVAGFFVYPGKQLGCFEFDDGTTQNWTLDQLYETKSQNKVKTFTPGTPPTYITYTPFGLANHNNIALEAATSLYLVSDQNVESADLYLESPDLSNDANWQDIIGYTVDVRREFFSPCFDPPNRFFAQVQLKIIDKADNSPHLMSEVDKAGKFKFHELKLNTPYPIKFKWGSKLKVGGKYLSPSDYKVKHVRVRFTMPGWISDGNCFYRGKWKIGNVCPLK